MRQNTWVRALDYLIESCWLLALVAVPIFFDTMTQRIFEPDKIVLFRNIVLVMVLAVLVRAILTAPRAMARAASPPPASDEAATRAAPWWRSEIARRPMVIPVIIFTLIYALATIHSVLPHISLWGSYDRMQGFYTWLNYIVFFFILAYYVRTWAQIERIINAFVFASVPVALYGIVQHLQWDPIQWGADTSIRVASSLGNAIFLGAYLIMCMPFAIYRLWRAIERLREPEPEPAIARGGAGQRARARDRDVIEINGLPPIVPVIGYALVLIIDFGALYFTGSRGPYYGFIVAMFVMGFPLMYKFENPYPALAGMALAVVLYGFLYVATKMDPVIAFIVFLVCLAVAAGIAFAPQLRTRARPAIASLVFLLSIFTFPQAVNVFAATSSSNVADTQHLTDLGINGTSEVRQYIWQGSLQLITHDLNHLILGYGPETMIYVYSPFYPSGLGHIEHANAAPDRNHDEWLDFVVFSGVLGLLAWLAVLATFAAVLFLALRRSRSRRATLLLAAILAIVVGHLAEATVGIDIVSTLMLLWTAFALATVIYARPELSAAETTALEAAGGLQTMQTAGDLGAATSNGAGRGRPNERAGRRNDQRPVRGRPARGQAAVATRPVAPTRVTVEHLTGAQQGVLLGLIVAALLALVGGGLMFWGNVQVVRADAAYKLGQGYDNAASACLGHAFNMADPNLAAQCPTGSQLTQQQIANYAGRQLIPQALASYQDAINKQPDQDMYYLWLGKTYLDAARYYQAVEPGPLPADLVQSFTNAQQVLEKARALNPYNADHPMNLGRMFEGWARLDPTKWSLADHYFSIAIGLARHNGRWADEWGNADMEQAEHRPGLTPAQRTYYYRQALAAFQHACAVDDLLGDARIYRGQAYQALGMNKQATASYVEALKVGGFETGQSTATAVEGLVTTLAATKDYAALVKPISVHVGPPGPVYVSQSPVTLALSPTVQAGWNAQVQNTFAPGTPLITQTLQAVTTTLHQKGLLK